MGNLAKAILRHFVASAVGGAAAYLTAKTGQDMTQAVEPLTGAVLVATYGAVNHLIKHFFPSSQGLGV